MTNLKVSPCGEICNKALALEPCIKGRKHLLRPMFAHLFGATSLAPHPRYRENSYAHHRNAVLSAGAKQGRQYNSREAMQFLELPLSQSCFACTLMIHQNSCSEP